MKTSVCKAAREIYGNRERLNMAPMAFDYVPVKYRGLRRTATDR